MAARGRKGGFILIVLALIIILGVVAGYLVIQRMGITFLQTAEAVQATQPVVAVETVDIVITTQNIPRGVALTSDVLATIPYPKADMVEGMFYTNIEDVVGKRAINTIEARLPLTSSMIVEGDTAAAAYPSFDIPANFTAVSVPISKLTSVSYGVQRGDHVMVIGCMLLVDLDSEFQTRLPDLTVPVIVPGSQGEGGVTTGTITLGAGGGAKGRAEIDSTLGLPVYVIPSEPQRPRLVCQTVIQDAVVLGVGEFEEPKTELTPAVQPQDPALINAQPPQPTEPTPVAPTDRPDVITIVVNPQDAIAINYMLLSGTKLSLALRNPTDVNPILTDAVTQQYLMDQKSIPLPAKLPYGMEPRISPLDNGFAYPGDSANTTTAPQQ
jgi:pilus assembly protein CpaB